jgi:hypothetical protein
MRKEIAIADKLGTKISDKAKPTKKIDEPGQTTQTNAKKVPRSRGNVHINSHSAWKCQWKDVMSPSIFVELIPAHTDYKTKFCK